MRLRFGFTIGALILSLSLTDAHALNRDQYTIFKAGSTGILGGALLGLIAIPGTHTTRSIFMGASIGLYIGLIAGFYHNSHRDDPQNPLYTPPRESEADPVYRMARMEQEQFKPVLLEVTVPVLQF